MTQLPRGQPQPTDAGWYTGRSVDYISKLSNTEFIHIEVQAARNPTMHWRMLNYFTLLQHRFGKWKQDDIRIHQFVVYLGTGKFGMDGSHPLFGEERRFKVINLATVETQGPLATSGFYGDHVVRLLFKDVQEDDWLLSFERFCSLQDEAVKLDAMFFLFQLAGLRDVRELIEMELKKASMYDALMDTPLTQRAAHRVAKGEIIESLNRRLKVNDQGEFDSDELERLNDDELSLEDLRQVQDHAMDGKDIRESLNRLQIGYKW